MFSCYSIMAALVQRTKQILGFLEPERVAEQLPVSMRIAKIPPKLTYYNLLSAGGTGYVYKISDHVAVKYYKQPDADMCQNEMGFFDLLEKHEPCPSIVESFLRVPAGNFLALMDGGSLHDRLESHKKWTDDRKRIVEITGKEPAHLVKRWLVELCAAASWLESLGYVHGDLRPPNLLLDRQEHLKLADFDCVAPIGSQAQTTTTPWIRLLGPEAGEQKGTFGLCGAQTEQVAIGSILYCLTRGHEPYEMNELEDITEPLWLFQRMEFPALSNDCFDSIIEKCWRGHFLSLREFHEQTKSLWCGDGLLQASSSEKYDPADIRNECQRLVDSGLLVFP